MTSLCLYHPRNIHHLANVPIKCALTAWSVLFTLKGYEVILDVLVRESDITLSFYMILHWTFVECLASTKLSLYTHVSKKGIPTSHKPAWIESRSTVVLLK